MNKKKILTSIVILLIVGLTTFLYYFWNRNYQKITTAEQAIGFLKQKYPQFVAYTLGNETLQTISVENADDGWYIAFIQNGSGRPIISADCFLVSSGKTIQQKTFTADPSDLNQNFSAKECTTIPNANSVRPPIVGGDSDEHGCIGSAGFSWCESKNKCLRIWEEPCESPASPIGKCVVENCHGLDIKCGSNPPQACTMIYQLGDKCLQHAKCGIQNGICQQITNPDFDACKKCVLNCQNQKTTSDVVDQFECESKCS